MKTTINYEALQDIEVDGIDTRDYPHFCDAFISSASYPDRDLTDDELDILNQDSKFVHECAMESLY